MHNQDFGPLKYMLMPFAPLVWWMNRQSDYEVLDEIANYQEVESIRLDPLRAFIELDPEEILYGESDYYEAYQHAGPFKQEFLRAAMEFDLDIDDYIEGIEGMQHTPLNRQQQPETYDDLVLAYDIG